jgi:hypothetical protein
MSDDEKDGRWKRMSQPPKEVLSKITFGPLEGKHSIDPTWRMLAMTQEYGPVAEGWQYKITDLSYQQVADQMMVVVEVGVQVKVNKNWSTSVPGVGTAMLVRKTGKGPYVDDDALKKALSDALSVCFKAFGVGADVYMGLFDGDKYQRVDQPKEKEKKEIPPKTDGVGEMPEWRTPHQIVNAIIPLIDSMETESGLKQLYKDNVADINSLPEGQKADLVAYFGERKAGLKHAKKG